VLPFPLCRPGFRQDAFVEPDLEGDGSAVLRYVKPEPAVFQVPDLRRDGSRRNALAAQQLFIGLCLALQAGDRSLLTDAAEDEGRPPRGAPPGRKVWGDCDRRPGGMKYLDRIR